MKSNWNNAKRVIELTQVGSYVAEVKESARVANCRVIEKGSTLIIAGQSVLTAMDELNNFVNDWNDNNSIHIIKNL